MSTRRLVQITSNGVRVIPHPVPWVSGGGLLLGIRTTIYTRDRGVDCSRLVRSLGRHMEDHTSPGTDPLLRLSIAVDLLLDGITANEVVVTLGEVDGPPANWLGGDFTFNKLQPPVVVAVRDNGERLSVAFRDVPSTGQIVSISADTAAASAVLSDRAVSRPDEMEDTLRGFHATGIMVRTR